MRVDLFHSFHFCLQTPIQYWLNLLYVCGQNNMTTLQNTLFTLSDAGQ